MINKLNKGTWLVADLSYAPTKKQQQKSYQECDAIVEFVGDQKIILKNERVQEKLKNKNIPHRMIDGLSPLVNSRGRERDGSIRSGCKLARSITEDWIDSDLASASSFVPHPIHPGQPGQPEQRWLWTPPPPTGQPITLYQLSILIEASHFLPRHLHIFKLGTRFNGHS